MVYLSLYPTFYNLSKYIEIVGGKIVLLT